MPWTSPQSACPAATPRAAQQDTLLVTAKQQGHSRAAAIALRPHSQVVT